MIAEVDYCSKVCGAKCCYHPTDKIRCIHLNSDKRCDVYKKRFGEGSKEVEPMFLYRIGNSEHKMFWCGRVKTLLEKGQILPEVEQQCCIAHPELLNGFVMVAKNPIRNEHYEAYRAGKYSEIPVEILALLDAQVGRTKIEAPKKEKAKKEE